MELVHIEPLDEIKEYVELLYGELGARVAEPRGKMMHALLPRFEERHKVGAAAEF